MHRSGTDSAVAAGVAYATVDAPLGPLVLAATETGLARVAFEPMDDVVAELDRRLSPKVAKSSRRLDRARRQIEDYFAGRRRDFDLPIDWSLVGTRFQRDVLSTAQDIPYGDVRSYHDVATATAKPTACRAVGNALGANPVCIVVPCHRVLRTGGALGGYAGGLHRKAYLLRHEQEAQLRDHGRLG